MCNRLHRRPTTSVPTSPNPSPVTLPNFGVDIMDLPRTQQGNKHVIVFQDFFTKWPIVYPVPDQKVLQIAQLFAGEIVPFFGVPEALLSDHGTNLLSHLVLNVCKLLGVKKLNTMLYYPQCDGVVEWFNRTLKTMLRKHASKFGAQWDNNLPGPTKTAWSLQAPLFVLKKLSMPVSTVQLLQHGNF